MDGAFTVSESWKRRSVGRGEALSLTRAVTPESRFEDVLAVLELPVAVIAVVQHQFVGLACLGKIFCLAGFNDLCSDNTPSMKSCIETGTGTGAVVRPSPSAAIDAEMPTSTTSTTMPAQDATASVTGFFMVLPSSLVFFANALFHSSVRRRQHQGMLIRNSRPKWRSG